MSVTSSFGNQQTNRMQMEAILVVSTNESVIGESTLALLTPATHNPLPFTYIPNARRRAVLVVRLKNVSRLGRV